MELKLAKDEVIVKSWDYSAEGGMFTRDKAISNLTLTNKRIISSVENEITLNRNEVPLSAVKTVNAVYGARRKFWPMVQAVVGGIFCLVLIGIPILKKALKKLRACTFDIVLETRYADFEGTPFTLGANAADVAPKKRGFLKSLLGAIPILGIPFRERGAKEKVISVKKEIAKEIINEIGAAIMDINA